MKAFIKSIESIARHHDIRQVFDDFMQMAICAFAQGAMEKEYADIAKRYNSEQIKGFAIALAEMLTAYEEVATPDGDWDDILGKFFEETNSISQAQRAGQFFTPKEVCKMMAMITCGTNMQNSGTASGHAKTVCDPSSGSGRNLIAHARLSPNNRLRCFYTAQDLDRRCVNMCVLNYVMYGMKGVVIHMNTLSMEIYGGYRIYLPEVGGKVVPLTAEQCKSYLHMPKMVDEIKPVKKANNKGKQIKLF